jgi:hypothetical protein
MGTGLKTGIREKQKARLGGESGLAVENGGFSRGAYFQRMSIVAKPTRASVHV